MINNISYVIAQAAPAGAAPASGGLLGNPMVFMVLMMVVMYFILIRPQRNKQKQADVMQKALSAGDEVITIGGAHGVVTSVKEKTVIVRMIEGKVEFDRSAIAQRVSKEVEAVVVTDKK